MANGKLPIDLETFSTLESVDSKLIALFKVLAHMASSGFECEEDREARLVMCEHRFAALERRKKFDTTFAGSAGFVGGAVVWAIKWAIGK